MVSEHVLDFHSVRRLEGVRIEHLSTTNRARSLAEEQGRMLQARRDGIPSAILSRLRERGELVRIGPGIYLGSKVCRHALWEAAALSLRHSGVVVGLMTALEHHELTDHFADGLWVLVPRQRNAPSSTEVRVVRVKKEFLLPELGIATIDVHGVDVQITEPLRTVVDCWRYSRRIPQSIAHDALKEVRQSQHWNGRRFYKLARAQGVWRKLRPYVEGLG